MVLDQPGMVGRTVGSDGLVSIHQSGETEYLARQDGTRTLWKLPLQNIFGPDRSTDGGWDFRSFRAQKVVVGAVGPATDESGTPASIPFGRSGGWPEPIWRAAGGGGSMHPAAT